MWRAMAWPIGRLWRVCVVGAALYIGVVWCVCRRWCTVCRRVCVGTVYGAMALGVRCAGVGCTVCMVYVDTLTW